MEAMMRVAFSGSRDFDDRPLVQSVIRRLYVKYQDLSVSVGDARGLDALVRKECGAHGVPFQVHYAFWEGLGKRAGHERNGRVLYGARVLFAFPLGRSPGTNDAIAQARAAGIPVCVWEPEARRWATSGVPLPSENVSGT